MRAMKKRKLIGDIYGCPGCPQLEYLAFRSDTCHLQRLACLMTPTFQFKMSILNYIFDNLYNIV